MLHDDCAICGNNESPDKLDRTQFALRIANGLKGLPPNTNMVLSIEGAWGVGKTSVLNLIQNEFNSWQEEDRPIVVKFSPWLVGRAEQLAQSFIVQLAAAIELQDHIGAGKNAAQQLLAYSKVFDVLRLLPGAEPWASIVKSVVEAAGGTAEKVSNLKELDLDKRRKMVTDSLAELGRRIVVFIDDLDRLPPQEVIEMVRLIKSVGEFPCIAYVVAFDAGYVEDALARQGIPESSSYLDKIVQVRLHVPDADSEKILALIDHEYDSLPAASKTSLPKTDERVQEVFYHGVRDLLQTPRDVKRLFNRLYFVEPACRGDVSLGDLIALEVIALKASTVYRHICDDPEAYVGRPLYQSFTMDDEAKVVERTSTERLRLIDSLPLGNRRPIQRLLSCLFPLTGPHTSWGMHADASVRGLIQEPSRLAIALSAGLPLREASMADAYALIQKPDLRKSILNDALARGRFARLLDHLHGLARETVLDLPSLAVALGQALDTSQAKEAEENVQSSIGLTPSANIWNFLEGQLDRAESGSAYSVLLALAKNPSSISLATMSIIELSQRLDAPPASGFKGPPIWASREELEELIEHWRTNVQTWLSAGRLIELSLGSVVLHYLITWCPDKAKALIDGYFSSDMGVDQLMLSIRDTGTDSINGRFIEFTSEDLSYFGGIDRLKPIARRRLAETTLPHRLKAIYTAIVSGRKVYTIDASIGN